MSPCANPGHTVLDLALQAGATLAGIADPARLGGSPSEDLKKGGPWPDWARSVLVLGLAHPADRPELDDWGVEGGTTGNLILIRMARGLAAVLEEARRIRALPLPYHIHRGGLPLKDAAVLAGLGVLGESNLLVTPRLGPRVRLRALLCDIEPAQEEPPSGFAPCAGCDRPCQQACPRQAFASGRYDRARCGAQMQRDEAAPILVQQEVESQLPVHRIRYCRACELACPVG